MFVICLKVKILKSLCRTRRNWTGLARRLLEPTQSLWKQTHAGRAQGVKMAELAGVGEGQIRRAG